MFRMSDVIKLNSRWTLIGNGRISQRRAGLVGEGNDCCVERIRMDADSTVSNSLTLVPGLARNERPLIIGRAPKTKGLSWTSSRPRCGACAWRRNGTYSHHLVVGDFGGNAGIALPLPSDVTSQQRPQSFRALVDSLFVHSVHVLFGYRVGSPRRDPGAEGLDLPLSGPGFDWDGWFAVLEKRAVWGMTTNDDPVQYLSPKAPGLDGQPCPCNTPWGGIATGLKDALQTAALNLRVPDGTHPGSSPTRPRKRFRDEIVMNSCCNLRNQNVQERHEMSLLHIPVFSMMWFGDKLTVLASRLTGPSLCVGPGSGKP